MKVQDLIKIVREFPEGMEVVLVHQGQAHALTPEHIYASVEDGVLNIGPGELVVGPATSEDAPVEDTPKARKSKTK